MQNKIIYLAILVLCMLMIPLGAMQFTDEVVWTVSDFVFMGTLLFGSGLAYLLIARKGGTTAYRAAVGVAVLATLLLVWVNAAVGIIGDGPVNAMYIVVPLVLIIGATIARLESHAMSRALFATAFAQALVPVVALIMWNPQTISWAPGVLGVFVLNAFFVILFVVSGLLFRHASAITRDRKASSKRQRNAIATKAG